MSDNWREVAERVRNWGKWGDSDQIGTLNYITPEKIIAASRLVTHGYGKTHFVATNATPEGRAQNRRVELVPTN